MTDEEIHQAALKAYRDAPGGDPRLWVEFAFRAGMEAGRAESLPAWVLDEDQPESMVQQIDDAWERASDAYAKVAGCLHGHLEWRDRVRAAIRELIASAPTKGE